MDSKPDFFAVERVASLCVVGISILTSGGFTMTSRPLVSQLGVVTAYAAFAFVGAIVLGVF